MTHSTPHARPLRRTRHQTIAVAVALACSPLLKAHSANTDISNQPLIHAQNTQQPNLMFLLDNSGSMAGDALPDNADDRALYAVWSWHCNSLAFNPSDPSVGHYEDLYALPVTHDGRNYPKQSLRAAWADGFLPTFTGSTYTLSYAPDTDSLANGNTATLVFTTLNLLFAGVGDQIALQDPNDKTHWLLGQVMAINGASYTIKITFTSFRNGSLTTTWKIGKVATVDLLNTNNSPATHYYYQHSADNPATATDDPPRPWKYDVYGDFDTTDTFTNQCMSSLGTQSSVFTQKQVSALDAVRQQQYANWYAYYRTRINMMRSAAGRAMISVPNNFRVGFNALNKGTSLNADVSNTLFSFASVAAFDANQRRLFYSNLYGTPTGGSTPLRRSLAKLGRYYGNRLTGQTDPIISTCQRNFSFVTTDGYWNESTSPTQLDGKTDIGNQDGLAPAPQNDGSFDYSTTDTRTTYSLQSGGNCKGKNQVYYKTLVEQRVNVTTLNGTTPGNWTTVSSTLQCGNMPSPSTSTTSTSTGGPALNSLADVAYYYYNTDLRPDLADQVPEAGDDKVKSQHMTTFTLGMGLSGRLPYTDNYTDPILATDSADVQAGKQTYIDLSNSSRSPRLYWPIPPEDGSSDPSKIDDLWHAAVNGHGRYFSASNATGLSSALKTAINKIQAQTGAGSSAATTSLRPVLGTDQVFIARYSTVNWTGELQAKTLAQVIDPTTKASVIALTDTNGWMASATLTNTTYTDRKIYYPRNLNSNARTLGLFDWATLSTDNEATALQSYFNNFCSKSPVPNQCTTMTNTDKTAASGANLVNFLRGDSTYETTLYRERLDPITAGQRNVLGDIVDASPVYVGKPPFNYTTNGYNTWKNDSVQKSRCPMVYVAANDGMLHAFSAKSAAAAYTNCPAAGTEVWAFVPRGVMSNLYRLADSLYSSLHIFTVNGGPVVGDVSTKVPDGQGGTTDEWHSILVGGLGAGGQSYYALDITKPVAKAGDTSTGPKLLWEFTDPDLGLTYGNPVIAQIPVVDPVTNVSTLTWCVIFSSGLNNGSTGVNSLNKPGYGIGYLYVVNALTGALVYKVPTLDGGLDFRSQSPDQRNGDFPSGFNKINVWVTNGSDSVVEHIYGTDLMGNVWRFAANNLYRAATATGPDLRSVRLAQLKSGGTNQPITVRPEIAEVVKNSVSYRVVLIGTGRYLGTSDATDTTTPSSIYAIKDPLSSTGWGNVRPSMVGQTLTNATRTENGATLQYRTISSNTVDWSSATTAGWYVDLPSAGERVAVTMNLAYNILSVPTLIPNSTDPCSNGGDSWLYNLDIISGSYVNTQTATKQGGYKTDKAIMGINSVQYDGTNQSGQIITNADGSTTLTTFPTPGTNTVRRTGWRELMQ